MRVQATKAEPRRVVPDSEGWLSVSSSRMTKIREEAQESGAKIFFEDEAHFRADADLRGKWVLKGEAALVDSTSPRGERRPATTREFVWRPGRWKPWK